MKTRRRINLGKLLLMALLAVPLLGCSTPRVTDYAQQQPQLNLADYFNGRVVAHGLFQKRNGVVARRFTVVMDGQWQGNHGVLDETFYNDDGSTERRVWRLTQHPDGRFTGHADDVVGEAQGQQSGNAFHWKYTLRLPVDGREYDVQFDDWMFLMDQRVMLNRATMRKFGINLGQVLLSFSKE